MPLKSKRRASVTDFDHARRQLIQLCAKGETTVVIPYSLLHLNGNFIFHRRVLAERRHADGGTGMLAALAE